MNNDTAKVVFVTGAKGYLGSALLAGMRDAGYRVIGLVRGAPADGQIVADLDDRDQIATIAEILPTPDVILHCSGSKDIVALERDASWARLVNARQLQTLNAVWGDQTHVVFMSSDYVFDGQAGPYRETDKPNPDTQYGKSKYVAERYLRRFHPKTTIVRLSSAYDASGAFPKAIITHRREGKPLSCYINTTYSPVYLPDFVRAIASIIRHSTNGLFHISGLPTTRYNFAWALAKTFWNDTSHIHPSEADESNLFFKRNLALDHSLASQELGYRPTPLLTSFEEMKAASHALHYTL